MFRKAASGIDQDVCLLVDISVCFVSCSLAEFLFSQIGFGLLYGSSRKSRPVCSVIIWLPAKLMPSPFP